MLYVFQMDIGQMWTFDMSLLMDTVARLQVEICKTTGIAVDHQILLLSGGQILKADQKVMTYGAGADTNPVFLFSKLAIESQDPPVIRSFMIAKDAVVALKERVTDALKMRPSFDTVNARAKLAIHMRDSAGNIYNYCKNEFQEQHLQHQGWAAVIANLEEIADALQRNEMKFNKVFQTFFPRKEAYSTMLEGFGEVLSLMNQIPLLDSLKDSCDEGMESKYKERSVGTSFHMQSDPSTLFEWICSQPQSQGIDCLHQKCEDDLKMFNESLFESYDKQVQDLLSVVRVDPTQMKELVGIERRLSELEKRLNEAKRIATSQKDMAQGFIQHQSKLGAMPDASSILPDLCESHRKQLFQMLESQHRMVALQNNFRNSKQEMSRNILQRLGWVMHIETKIDKLDGELRLHIKTLKVLECNIKLLSQIKISPQVYADLILETARRKKFSHRFSKWAEVLEVDANRLYETETQRRKQFYQKHGDHFLMHTMFKGFEDKPPNIATKVPRLLDAKLPEITTDEISWLKSSVPELESSLSLDEPPDQFPDVLLCTYSKDNTQLDVHHAPVISNSQAPCVVTATEVPATPFTIPESSSSSKEPRPHQAPSNTLQGTSKRDAAVETPVKSVANKSSQGDAKENTSKETQTNGANLTGPENKCVGTADDSESDSKTGTAGKQSSNTESSSPHSSTEFATADFYFEDSMPSPMVETDDRKSGNRIKSESKEDLVNQLKEKGNTIEELTDILKQKEDEIVQLQSELRTHRGENSGELEFFSLIGPLEEADTDQKDSQDASVFKGSESASCQTDSSVGDRVNDLEQKLEKLTNALDQSQLSLTKAEKNLQTVQEQEQTMQEESKCLIAELQKEISEQNGDLVKTKADLESKVAEILMLKDALNVVNNERELLQADLEGSNERFETLQSNLKDFVSQIKISVPCLREDLEVLKTSLNENLSQLDVFKSSALGEIEEKVLFFSSVGTNLEEEREEMRKEVNRLGEELLKTKKEDESKISSLRDQIVSLREQLSKQVESFDVKHAKEKNDFDYALKDLETKHELALELELDKCRAEMGEIVVQWEKKYNEENEAKSQLVKDIKVMRGDFQIKEENIESLHQRAITDLEAKHDSLIKQTSIEWREKLDEYKCQVQALEMEAVATAAVVNKEKEDSLDALRKELVTEHGEYVQDLVQRHDEKVKRSTKMAEDQQLENAYKLGELKQQFDQEMELYQVKLQRDAYNKMSTSHTQTERELLAEVISLTSSASDGMEEMAAAKPAEDTTDPAVKPKSPDQGSEEGLSRQLEMAHDAIRSLEEKIQRVESQNAELKDQLEPQALEGATAQLPTDMDGSQYQNMMQTSATGKSFILMEKEKRFDPLLQAPAEDKLKDQTIAHLEKRIMKMSMTGSVSMKQSHDKISFRGCDIGDLVLLCLDEKHDQYVVFTVGTNPHFLHSDSLEGLGLKQADAATNRKPWIVAEVLDKEYCLAKKPNNRFRVPQGTCFYRVKCQPWKCKVDLTRHKDKDTVSVKQKTGKSEGDAVGSKTKKADKK